MELVTKFTVCLALALAAAGAAGTASAQHEQEQQRRAPEHGEPHAGPRTYSRVVEPKGWDHRPAGVDRHVYQHNYQAARSFRIGVYHRPGGWAPHHWVYGEVLPRAYWAAPYILADYWLFALEVPPAGYEWVRDDTDALLVNVATGEILQVEYGVFA
ncbi:MAG TPA: RcnB family protein [Steroidobacteraceae bacterium]|nr:RcnB family protein [Steroidobacteraceae bacterium]